MSSKAEKLIRLIYDNFIDYFKSGDIIIAGSYFYDKIGVPIEKTFKDIDLIVDFSKDHILYELMDFFKNHKDYDVNEQASFIKSFDGIHLLSCIVFNNDHPPIDVLRQDFSTNLSSFEILPGVFTDYQTSEKLVEVYEGFLKGLKNSGKQKTIEKFEALRNFYKSNSTKELVETLSYHINKI